MQNTPRHRDNLLLVFLTWLLLYCSFALPLPPLLDDADSVHAEVAREMVVRHDWVTLYANGIRYLEKAPLLYWSMAASYKVFGVASEAAARLPLALYVLALAWMMWWFGRKAFSERTGFYAALVLLTSFGMFIFTRILIPDAMVCLWLTASLYCFWLAEKQEKPPLLPCMGFGAACALNVLTKGLIGLVFPFGIALLYLLAVRGWRGAWRRVLQFQLLPAIAVFLLIAAPWHLLIAAANPTEGHPGGLSYSGGHWHVPLPTYGNVHGWTWFYFMNEHVLRYLNLRVPRDYDTVPLLLFWGLMLVWMLPWSAYVFKALGAVPWRNAWRRKGMDEEGRLRLLLGIWVVLPLLFFSLSTRQEYYVLPAMPAMALLIAKWLDEEAMQAEAFDVPAAKTTAGQRIAVALLCVGAAVAFVCGYFLLHTQPMLPGTDLSTLLQQNPGEYALSMGHFLDLNAQVMGAFRLPLAMTGVAFFVGALVNWWARSEYKPWIGNAALVVASAVFLMAAHIALQRFAPVLGSKQLAMAVMQEYLPGDLIVINDEFEGGSTMAFYTQQQVHILHGRSANLWYGSFFTDAPKIFETDATIAEKWKSKQRIFLWTEPQKLPTYCQPVYIVAASGGKEIVSNRQPHVR